MDAGGTLTTLVAGIDTFGSIVIDDSAAFVGILDLALVDGFDFSEGETYQLFSFASSTGDFTSGLSVDGQALTSAGEVSQPASAPAGLKTPSVTQAWRWT